MNKTTEELIWEIHDTVTGIKADMKAEKTVCMAIHNALDTKVLSLDKTLNGNGRPGLAQRFDRLEAKVVAWTTAAIVAGQVLAPIIKDMVK